MANQHILGNFIKSFNSVGGLTLVLNRRGEIVTLNQTEVTCAPITKIIASNSIFFSCSYKGNISMRIALLRGTAEILNNTILICMIQVLLFHFEAGH